MRHLKANTQVKVVIGPFVDVTDGFTPETGITLGAADEAELMKHDAASVTDISGATWAAITNMDGYYNLTLTTSHTDTEGMIVIAIQDDSVCLPVRMEFMVLSEAAYDSIYTAKDTGYMDVNIKAVSEDTTAADNLESACDNYSATRGLAGTALPNAAADAAGGLPISDAGGLDLDTMDSRISKLRETLYPNGSVYVDVDDGSAGTTSYTNGTIANPANTLANGKTIADALNLKTIVLIAETNVTLPADTWTSGYTIIVRNPNCELDLNSQTVNDMHVIGGIVTGSASTGAMEYLHLTNSAIEDVTLPRTKARHCYFEDGITLGETGVYEFVDIMDTRATSENVQLDFGSAVGASTVVVSGFSGSITVKNMGTGDVLRFMGQGKITFDSTNDDGTASVGGSMDITDSSTGSFALSTLTSEIDVNKWNGTAVTGDGDWNELQTAVDSIDVLANYPLGAVYFDSTAANTNTTLGTDGTMGNPVSSWAAAKSLADSLGTKKIIVAGQMSVTTTATGYGFIGERQGNGSSVSSISVAAGITFEDCNVEKLQFTSTATSTLDDNRFFQCRVYGNTSKLGGEYIDCIIDGDQFSVQNNTIIIGGSTDANDTQIQFDVDASVDDMIITRFGATSIVLGAVTTNNTVAVVDCSGELQIGGTCTGGTITVVGDMKITDNSLGSTVTLTYNGVQNIEGSDATDQINAACDTALSDMFTSSAQLVDDIWDEPLTGATHNVATSSGRRLRNLGDYEGYQGFIWIDTVNGTAGTVDYENGTSINPVDSIADALTLSASLNIFRFQIANDSSITLAASVANKTLYGHNWTLALGGQNIAGAHFSGATVTGIGTGSGYDFHDCDIGNCTLADGDLINCGIAGDLTLSAAGTYYIESCFSGVAGTATPSVDFGAAVGNTNLNMRHYSGGIEIKNMNTTGTDTMSLEGQGQLVINANCAGGTIAIRGNFGPITDNASAAVTLVETGNISSLQGKTYAAASFDRSTDSLEANRDNIGTTGAALSNVSSNLVQIEGASTIDTLSITNYFKRTLAYQTGNVARSGNAYAYKDQAGTSTLFTHTVASGGRTRS